MSVGVRSLGKVIDHCAAPPASDPAARAAASSETAGAGASRVSGIIQRSISRSKTDSVPIQKIANNTAPSTTPIQVWIVVIAWRRLGLSFAESMLQLPMLIASGVNGTSARRATGADSATGDSQRTTPY